jgi:hypothetical protein
MTAYDESIGDWSRNELERFVKGLVRNDPSVVPDRVSLPDEISVGEDGVKLYLPSQQPTTVLGPDGDSNFGHVIYDSGSLTTALGSVSIPIPAWCKGVTVHVIGRTDINEAALSNLLIQVPGGGAADWNTNGAYWQSGAHNGTFVGGSSDGVAAFLPNVQSASGSFAEVEIKAPHIGAEGAGKSRNFFSHFNLIGVAVYLTGYFGLTFYNGITVGSLLLRAFNNAKTVQGNFVAGSHIYAVGWR